MSEDDEMETNPYLVSPDRLARERASLFAEQRRERQRAAVRRLAARLAPRARGPALRLALEVEQLNLELEAQRRRTTEAGLAGEYEGRRRAIASRRG